MLNVHNDSVYLVFVKWREIEDSSWDFVYSIKTKEGIEAQLKDVDGALLEKLHYVLYHLNFDGTLSCVNNEFGIELTPECMSFLTDNNIHIKENKKDLVGEEQ